MKRTDHRAATDATVRTVAAVIVDEGGRVLLVRKRGSPWFIQPGGKPQPGEMPLDTLARELAEELGVRLRRAPAQHLGVFEDAAVHEPGRRVRAEAWLVAVDGQPRAQAEIEALAWVSPTPPYAVAVAPLSARGILPALVRLRDGAAQR